MCGLEMPSSGIMVPAVGLQSKRTSAAAGSSLFKRACQAVERELQAHQVAQSVVANIMTNLARDPVIEMASVRCPSFDCAG